MLNSQMVEPFITVIWGFNMLTSSRASSNEDGRLKEMSILDVNPGIDFILHAESEGWWLWTINIWYHLVI